MRYYDIQITNVDGSPFARYTSLMPSGFTDPGALTVEFDIPVAPMHAPAGNALVRVWGLPLKDFSNAKDFNLKKIKIYGGMQRGLPLSNPNQVGLLVQGQIFQAFGNWVETDMTVTFILAPATDSPLVFNWKAGTALSTAIGNMLSTVFRGVKQNININSGLVLNHDQVGIYESLTAFGRMMNDLSKSIITGSTYPGVTIGFDGTLLSVFDQPNKKTGITVQLADLIGQPVWIAPQEIQCLFVMRGDINLADAISLPATPVTTTAAALTQFSDPSTFSGQYMVKFIRHVGNSRQPDGKSWNTTVNMIPIPKT